MHPCVSVSSASALYGQDLNGHHKTTEIAVSATPSRAGILDTPNSKA
jgi:hypothetical protein